MLLSIPYAKTWLSATLTCDAHYGPLTVFRTNYRLGQTALHLAVLSGETDVIDSLVGAMQRGGASLMDLGDRAGNTALHLAAEHRDSADLFRRLTECDAAAHNDLGETAFHVASRSLHEINVERLLHDLHRPGRRFDVDEPNKWTRETALHVCARRGDWHRIEQLVRVGADLASKDRHGNTALHVAVEEAAKNPAMMDDFLQVSSLLYRIHS